MTLRIPAARRSWVGVCCRVAAAVAAAGAIGAAQTKAVPPVDAAALQKLLPTIEGWTAGVARSDLVELSPTAKYTIASVTLTKDGQRVRLTLADTGLSADSLTALETMVVTLPDDYAGEVGTLAIKRTSIGGSPAVEAWDAGKSAGEVAVVVGGRFVAALEAAKIDSLATLRGMLDKIDLKALAALK